jgi:hypothetical protein
VLSIPPEAKTKDIPAWELYGSFGIQPGAATMGQTLQVDTENGKKAETNKPKKTKFG